MTVLIVLSVCNFYNSFCISLIIPNILWPHFMTMIRCDLYIGHFYVFNILVLSMFSAFFDIKKEMGRGKNKGSKQNLKQCLFGSSFNSLSKTVCVL